MTLQGFALQYNVCLVCIRIQCSLLVSCLLVKHSMCFVAKPSIHFQFLEFVIGSGCILKESKTQCHKSVIYLSIVLKPN